MSGKPKRRKVTSKAGSEQAAVNLNIDPELAVKIYKDMCFYRRFEERVGLAYTKRKFSGFCHLHIGQEALAVGVKHAIKDSDFMISGYRSHTQAISKGVSPGAVMAELFGKAAGACRGKGGSMHMFDRKAGFFGGHGIVGGQVPIAVGIGFAIRYREQDNICVCYLGDAATNQGAFHEGLNMAATWDLPVLFIIENNKYGMGTDIRRTTSVDHLWKRALSYDMDHCDVDGMNAMAVYQTVSDIVSGMRDTRRPFLLEALTYRYRGHSVSDPGTYRTKEEVREYQETKDPIKRMAKYLLEQAIATEPELKEWDKLAKHAVTEAEIYADQAESPPVQEAMDHLLS